MIKLKNMDYSKLLLGLGLFLVCFFPLMGQEDNANRLSYQFTDGNLSMEFTFSLAKPITISKEKGEVLFNFNEVLPYQSIQDGLTKVIQKHPTYIKSIRAGYNQLLIILRPKIQLKVDHDTSQLPLQTIHLTLNEEKEVEEAAPAIIKKVVKKISPQKELLKIKFLWSTGEKAKAFKQMEDHYAKHPDHLPTALFFIEMKASSGKIKEAIALTKQALEKHPNEPSLLDRLKSLQSTPASSVFADTKTYLYSNETQRTQVEFQGYWYLKRDLIITPLVKLEHLNGEKSKFYQKVGAAAKYLINKKAHTIFTLLTNFDRVEGRLEGSLKDHHGSTGLLLEAGSPDWENWLTIEQEATRHAIHLLRQTTFTKELSITSRLAYYLHEIPNYKDKNEIVFFNLVKWEAFKAEKLLFSPLYQLDLRIPNDADATPLIFGKSQIHTLQLQVLRSQDSLKMAVTPAYYFNPTTEAKGWLLKADLRLTKNKWNSTLNYEYNTSISENPFSSHMVGANIYWQF